MKKLLKVCVCGLTAAALLSGCSKPDAAKETTAAETTAAETTAESAAAETAAMVDLAGIDNGSVTLGDYKGIEVVKKLETIDEETLDGSVKESLTSKAEYKDMDHPVELWDTVNIDYVGTKDGVAFDGGTADGYDLTIGSGSFIDGFEDGLIGAKKGEEVVLPLTFPENYGNADLAGQAVEFKVKVNSIQGFDVDDALVAANTDYKTVDEYKEALRGELEASAEENAMEQVKSDIMKKLVETSTFEPSQEAIDANYQNFVAQYTNQAAAFGMGLSDLAGAYGMTEDVFKQQLQLMAAASVEQRLVFNAIAEKENITITDEDRDRIAADLGFEDREAMIEQAGAFTVDDYILSDKVMDLLVENAVIK